jgi:AcrR family transcriptional regulator
MQRVAARAGAATMALYRHVPGKDELIALMLDAAIGRPPVPADDAGWRAGLAGWARANRDVFVRHPWTLELVPTPRTLGPCELAWVEAALGLLAGTGLSPSTRLNVLLLVNGYVRGAAAELTGPRLPSPDAVRRAGRTGRHPHLDRALADAPAAAGETTAESAERFEFGLARVLDGIEVFVQERAAADGPAEPRLSDRRGAPPGDVT